MAISCLARSMADVCRAQAASLMLSAGLSSWCCTADPTGVRLLGSKPLPKRRTPDRKIHTCAVTGAELQRPKRSRLPRPKQKGIPQRAKSHHCRNQLLFDSAHPVPLMLLHVQDPADSEHDIILSIGGCHPSGVDV